LRARSELQALPMSSMAKNFADQMLCKVYSRYLLPPAHSMQASAKRIQLAETDLRQKSGFVLDYDEVDSDQTDFTFQTGTTYLSGVNNYSINYFNCLASRVYYLGTGDGTSVDLFQTNNTSWYTSAGNNNYYHRHHQRQWHASGQKLL
jgi:hypothetical protein